MAEQDSQKSCHLKFNLFDLKNINTDDSSEADTVGYGEIERAKEKEKLRQLQDDREGRKKYAEKVFQFISLWSIGLFIILLLDGFQKINFYIFGELLKLNFRFHLHYKVMITLLATSFIEVLGLFYCVMNYLFYKEDKKNAKHAGSSILKKR